MTMEDFYDIKTAKIDGQTVCLFGIFDGLFLYYEIHLLHIYEALVQYFRLSGSILRI